MIALPKLRWNPSPNFDTGRGGHVITQIIWHDCEGSYAGAVNWFTQRQSEVSAHYVQKEDGTEVTQMVRDADKAWHACSANSHSIGYEMGGVAKRGYPDVEVATAARVIAYLLHKHKLPCRWAANGIGAGFCRHYDLGAMGGGHHDPVTDPKTWQTFVAQVVAAYKAGVPSAWTGEQ